METDLTPDRRQIRGAVGILQGANVGPDTDHLSMSPSVDVEDGRVRR